MTKRRSAILVIFSVFMIAVLGLYKHVTAQHSLPPPEHLHLSASKVFLPLAFFGGRPVVEVKVNGKGPYRFIFDTGAGGNVVSNELAVELGLPVLAHAKMGRPGSDKPLPATVTRLGKLELSGAVAEGVSAVSSDLSVLSALGHGDDVPRGVLSSTAFPGWLVSVNFPEARLEIDEGELPTADNQTIFEWKDAEAVPSVPLRMGEVEFNAHIDSGSGSGITLSATSASKLPLEEKHVEKDKARFVDSEFEVTTAKLRQKISIGSIVLIDPLIRFHAGSAEANIGQDVLKAFIVRIDAKNRRIQLSK